MTDQRVAVSGAAGFIGSAVVRRLVRDGRSVRAIVEPGGATDNLREFDANVVEQVTADVCDREAMLRALDGCEVYYHLAAVYRLWTPNPEVIFRVNVEGTTTSLLAAKHVGVRRVVYTSSIAAVGLRPNRELSDETTEFNLYDIANPYVLTKHLSERVAKRLAEAGQDIVIVNPAFPFGPGDIGPTPTGRIVLGVLRGEIPGAGEGGFCAVDVDDVASGHVAAEAKGRRGERYILGNHNVTFKDFLCEVARVTGTRAPKMHLPSILGQGIALGMELWADHVSHKTPQATLKGLKYMQRYAYFDATKARRELDFPSTPLEQSIESAARYFRARGLA